ncbi:MAG: protein-glutamate O-methyltransferase CheR [Candidatus Riflebacteria bacterium]
MRILAAHELALWIQLIFDLTGISLNEGKEYLIRERLDGLLKKYRCNTFSHLYFLAKEPERIDVRNEIIDHITVKETSFFRDNSPFEALRHHILPELLQKIRNRGENRPVRIWSAACATGQEAYSIAMILREIGARPGEYRIIATDISHQALDIAKSGTYSRFEVERGVPRHMLERFFTPVSDSYQIDPTIKESVIFDRLELHQPFFIPERFDLIVCRNVAIYFSTRDREKLFQQIRRHLNEDGYLLLGSTESTRDLCPLFNEARIDSRSVFLKPAGSELLLEKR